MDYRVSAPPAHSSGVRTLVQQLAGVSIHSPIKPTKFFESRAVTINDSPRAGQWWEIQGVYFEFPEANKSAILLAGKLQEGEAEFKIQLSIGGVIVAKQIFLTRMTQIAEEPGEKWPLTGNLEAFQSMIVYPGQSIEIFYELTFPTHEATGRSAGFAETLVGKTVISYIRHST